MEQQHQNKKTSITIWPISIITILIVISILMYFSIHPFEILSTNIYMDAYTVSENNNLDTNHLTFDNYYIPLHWKANKTVNSSKFPHLNISYNNSNNLGKMNFLISNNITKISILGDSNARWWVLGLKRYFDAKNRGHYKQYRSYTKRSEKGSRLVDASYFDDKYLLHHTRECSGCQSLMYRASFMINTSNYSIDIEYLSKEFVMDTELQRFRSHWDADIDTKKRWFLHEISITTQEYYFKHYFKKWGYPDIMLLYASTMHDIKRFTATEYRRNFKYFIQLILDYIPISTKVVWFTTLSFRLDPYHTNDVIYQFSKIAFDYILKYGNNRIVIAPFNIFNLTKDFHQLNTLLDITWSRDNAHMQQSFYDYMSGVFWSWIQTNWHYFANNTWINTATLSDS